MSDYRGCWIIQCFLVQSNMVTVPHNMVGLERMLDYRGVRLQRFHCILCTVTVEPPNKGYFQFGDKKNSGGFVFSREVVPFWEVQT